MGKNKRVGHPVYYRLADEPSTPLGILLIRLAFSLIDGFLTITLFYNSNFNEYDQALKQLYSSNQYEMYWTLFAVNYVIMGLAVALIIHWKSSDEKRAAGLFTLLSGGSDLYFIWFTVENLEIFDWIAIILDLILLIVGIAVFNSSFSQTRRRTPTKRTVPISQKTTSKKDSEVLMDWQRQAEDAMVEKQWHTAILLWRNVEKIASRNGWGEKVSEAQKYMQICAEKKREKKSR